MNLLFFLVGTVFGIVSTLIVFAIALIDSVNKRKDKWGDEKNNAEEDDGK
jgi:hypothetical protein